MIHNYSYSYNNVVLKPLSEKDINCLRIWRNDKKNCMFLSKLPFITEKMQLEWFENYKNNPNEMSFSIYETVDLNRLVGSLSLYDFQEDQAEFGKLLIGDCEAHGKGIGYSALTAALKIAFIKLNLKRVFLHVYVDNKPALHIYKKCGFTIIDTHIKNCMEELTMEINKDDFIKRMEEHYAQHE